MPHPTKSLIPGRPAADGSCMSCFARLRACRPPGAGRERATGMLELVVAATLILAAILATVAVIDSSSRAVVASESSSSALEVARSDLESLRARPYGSVGLDPGAAGFLPGFEGRPTVELAGSTISPSERVTLDGKDYLVTRHITRDGPIGSGPAAAEVLKRLTVEVRWDEDRSLRLDSSIATTCSATTTTTTTTTTPPVAPPPDDTTTSTPPPPPTTTTTTAPPRSPSC